MTWEEVCDEPLLQDLPYKIELNKWGNIEMSPARNRHSKYQGKIIGFLLSQKEGGEVFPECSIQTTENVKVADVVWVSVERDRSTPHEFAYATAPEICVEIVSPTNSLTKQMHKGRLYLQAGAEEFWLCDELGNMRFFAAEGQIQRSKLCPGFPTAIKVSD